MRFIIFCILAGLSLWSVDPAVADEDPEAALDERVPTLMERYSIPGVAIALIDDGRLSGTAAYGYADRSEGRTMTAHTPVRAESITKSLTAWGIMRLVEATAVELDDPVNEHLQTWAVPPGDFDPSEVTIRRVLSHSAGLPAGFYPDQSPGGDSPALQEMLDGWNEAPAAVPETEPGASFTYSNPGFVLLEQLIEDVTQENFGAFLTREVLEPLGMRRSTVAWSDTLAERLAMQYDLSGAPVSAQPYVVRGHGGLYSTAEDLGRFWAAGMDGGFGHPPGRGVLTAASVEKLYSPVISTDGFYALGADAAGLGHFIDRLDDGTPAVFHGGEGTGYLHMAYGVPEQGVGIVILTNSKRRWPFLGDVLGEWAATHGIEGVAISQTFGTATTVAYGVLALLSASIVWLLWSVGWGLWAGRRRFSPVAADRRWVRAAQALTAVGLTLLWWGLAAGVVGGLLSHMASWIGSAIGILAVLLLIAAASPLTK